MRREASIALETDICRKPLFGCPEPKPENLCAGKGAPQDMMGDGRREAGKATLCVFAASDLTFLRWEMEEGWVELLLSLPILVHRVRGVGRVHCWLSV